MAYTVLFSEEALADLEEILDFVSLDNPKAAERFGKALLDHIEMLGIFPRLGVRVPHRPAVRKILHSPVRIYYRIHEDRKVVEILHFWHAARKGPIL